MSSASLSLAERYVRVRQGLALKERSPLDFWHFAVPRLREAFALLESPEPVSELHAIGPNKGTKTQTDAAYIVACAQKRATLDGVALPRWSGPVECVQMVLDYPQQLLSVQPAYFKVLGHWPHHARYSGAILKSLHVMPAGGDPRDEHGWSVIHFMSEEGRRLRGTRALGVRADVVGFDEPPHIDTLRELRKAAHSGRRLILLLGWTPTVRSQWAPVLEDIGREIGLPQSRDRIIRIDRRRAAVRWSLSDVSERVLSRAEKDDLLLSYLGPDMDWDHPLDPLAKARWYGDAIDTSGLCPFHLPTLQRMLDECTDPEVVDWKITQEADDESGRTRVTRTVPVEVWGHAKIDRSYFAPIDPSSGIDDNLHDPYEIEIAELGSGDLQARSGGYLSGYLTGVLGTGMARQYNNAKIDPEVNDRWGVNVVEGVHASGYANFARERRELRPGSGEWSNEIGFHNNKETRPLIIGAIQAWVDARRAGIRYAHCPSRKIIETLMDCILDQNGKIVGAPGVHDECLIVWGQALRRCVRRHGMDIPEFHTPVRTREQEIMALVRGEQNGGDQEPPGGFGGGLLYAERPGV
jgi:hypothetical protein